MSGVRPKRATPRRRTAPRWTPAQWDEATEILRRRSRDRCERCGGPVSPHKAERHHRQKRTVGGDRLSNILYLDSGCHAWITEHPEAAIDAGWIVRSLGTPTQDPEEIPVRVGLYQNLVRLTDDGRMIPVP